ncbi:hypothetical protein ONS95_003426 [Cadophora gregata]|uniref:uncharacterized protein n=1 Tax=Cadophora gregata TaxID=51156 RepID=UPI0026DDC793|nr:uncharacterized protein ONS95_003426 [Cadophora gregata]KAK0108633.1 hypothetical protein ONS95_003426 [Cadophora gregata]KAK0108776.1 hypothetical protein ONS96_002621 [Cadophora gregata f. sp. sojae]
MPPRIPNAGGLHPQTPGVVLAGLPTPIHQQQPTPAVPQPAAPQATIQQPAPAVQQQSVPVALQLVPQQPNVQQAYPQQLIPAQQGNQIQAPFPQLIPIPPTTPQNIPPAPLPQYPQLQLQLQPTPIAIVAPPLTLTLQHSPGLITLTDLLTALTFSKSNATPHRLDPRSAAIAAVNGYIAQGGIAYVLCAEGLTCLVSDQGVLGVIDVWVRAGMPGRAGVVGGKGSGEGNGGCSECERERMGGGGSGGCKECERERGGCRDCGGCRECDREEERERRRERSRDRRERRRR